jgi:hypothetical protein
MRQRRIILLLADRPNLDTGLVDYRNANVEAARISGAFITVGTNR